MSNGKSTHNESLLPELKTGCSTQPPSTAIFEHSIVAGTPQHIREWLTSLPPDSPANLSASPASNTAPMTNEICGLPQSQPFAWYDHDTACWRMYQASFLMDILPLYSETWPRAGLMHDGECYQRPNWERRINEIDSGLWRTNETKIPTPTVKSGAQTKENPTPGQTGGTTLAGWVQMFPTPTDPSKGGGTSRSGDRINEPASLHGMARHGRWPTLQATDATKWSNQTAKERREKGCGVRLPHAVQAGGQLNPMWVEWLMGWPLGWTDLKPLGMVKFRLWLLQHGDF